jgi:hypothetical protein
MGSGGDDLRLVATAGEQTAAAEDRHELGRREIAALLAEAQRPEIETWALAASEWGSAVEVQRGTDVGSAALEMEKEAASHVWYDTASFLSC